MKTAFIHGQVNPHQKQCTAFVIEGNKFIYTGDDETATAMADEIVDLRGRCVLPGFNDSHMHLLNTGSFLANLDLTSVQSGEEILELLKQKKKDTPKGQWITGRGYNEDNFTKGVLCTRRQLDEICPEHPVMLIRCCGHQICVNSMALAKAHITENTQVDGGTIDYEHGILTENANELVKGAKDEATVEEIEHLFTLAAELCNRYGITSVQSDDFMTLGHDYDKVLEALVQMNEKGTLKVRLHEQCQFPDIENFKRFLADNRRHIHSDFLSMGPLKILQDGSLGARTAALSRPYSDAPDTQGMIVVPEKTLEAFIQTAKDHHMGACVHVIGDEACETVLNAYEKINESYNPLRSGLVHVQITRPDQLKRIERLHLHNYIQSIFIDYDARIVKQRVGELEESSYAFKTLAETATISNGSDSPVELPDVLKGIECAVSRTSITNSACSMNPKEALTLTEAIDSYTIGGAYASFEENLKGKIQEGMLADFVILDKNPYTVPVQQIHTLCVEETWLDGKRVYLNSKE